MMEKDDLDEVFSGSGDMGMDGMGPDPEAEDAEDAAIDEMFAAEDPETKREAFKRAVRLCVESGDY